MASERVQSLRHGVLTLTGYGLRLAVDRGHLLVEDGAGAERSRRCFSRVDQELKRIVVIGHSGSVTLDAVQWLHSAGVPLTHLDHDGRVYFVSARGAPAIAELRRAQTAATLDDRGCAIARDLLMVKIEGQRAMLDQLPAHPTARGLLDGALNGIQEATTTLALRDWESRAARAYWSAWKPLPIHIDTEDARRRPAHWRTFGSRNSLLAGLSARLAVNPANAVLNYLYAVLEAETTIAALGARLDPSLGFLHADRSERPSLTCDLMEPVRPAVDAFALQMFRERVFAKEEIFERHDGHCRLLPPLTRELASTAGQWAREVEPVIDAVAQALIVKRRSLRNILPGVRMPRQGRVRKHRPRNPRVRSLGTAEVGSWSQLREQPGWKGTQKWRQIRAANDAWNRSQGPSDPTHYRATILPKLADVPLVALGRALGLSKTSCNQIRRGTKIPHPRHWESLRQLVMAP